MIQTFFPVSAKQNTGLGQLVFSTGSGFSLDNGVPGNFRFNGQMTFQMS